MQAQKEVDIKAVIGFSGNVYDGLLLHPDNEHIVYPLGSTVVIRHILSRTQTFLRGHDNKVSSKIILYVRYQDFKKWEVYSQRPDQFPWVSG